MIARTVVCTVLYKYIHSKLYHVRSTVSYSTVRSYVPQLDYSRLLFLLLDGALQLTSLKNFGFITAHCNCPLRLPLCQRQFLPVLDCVKVIEV